MGRMDAKETFFERWTLLPVQRGIQLVRDKCDPDYCGLPVTTKEVERLRGSPDEKAFQALLHNFSQAPLGR